MMANGKIEWVNEIVSVSMQIGLKGKIYPVKYLPSLSDDLIFGIDIHKDMQITINSTTSEWWYSSDPGTVHKFYTAEGVSKMRCSRLCSLTQLKQEQLTSVVEVSDTSGLWNNSSDRASYTSD